ncbi:undecaprenyl-diphosphate phosphatase [Paracoccus sp. S1E-3]|uniref:undecaprenyl-diphosphate phosphatase n=1 Tax=Paracoccus sp. S1E-3 TaxID=2756130 RepID=UPI0015EF050B|nr:undecaprenyl-diphosphate phosphatase [Paracoccus sp. S1E-3]MBA4490826.1 undecaprenyl-diphosphate phosphatase [Paracoccus sp. S1E-3]
MNDTIVAGLLGLLEGLTEFIPVSSTGHILLAGHFLGFDSPGRAFEVLIQLGAIMAILGVYAGRLVQIFTAAPHDPVARRFILSVLLAFLPAVVVGVLAHDFIKTVLFETPMLIAIMLIVGGVILLFVDRYAPPPTVTEVEDIPPSTALKIGVVQCLAMVPGVSRSGATIVGAMLMGVGKRAAAEFSFFLSMPTMAGAFVYDLLKNRDILDAQAMGNIVVGFVCAFIAAVFVVKWLLTYVSKHGYALFAWWRIIVGTLVLLALSAGM